MGRASTLGLAVLAAALAANRGDAAEPPVMPTRDEVFDMVQAQDFGRLEQLTSELRQIRLGFYNGWPPIHTFYDQLDFTTSDDADWKRYIHLYSDWAAAFPESPTPRVALARLYVSYAWEARGTGWSDSVTPEGRRLFKERLGKAQGILEQAKSLKVQDAEVYLTSITVDLGLGLPRKQVEDDASRGLSVNPDFTPIYSAEANYLLPKWYGKDGDWESYAAQAADKLGGDDGDILYMFIVRSVASDFGSELFGDRRLSYPRMKRGFQVSLSRYPTNNFELNSFCYFASIGGDSETAAGLFRQIGNQYYEDVWGNSKTFENWRNWALSAAVKTSFWERNLLALEICGVWVVLLLGLVFIILRKEAASRPPATSV